LDLFEEELVILFKAFQSANLSYIMVGGFATNLHGFNRFTADLDIWIKDTPANKLNFRKAIASAGYGDFLEYETMEFLPGWTTLALNNGMELDIMTYMANYTAANFDACYELAPIMDILGNQLRVLNLNHLIAEKAKLGRPKDLIDLEELEKIRSHKK
jgi:hypothetical protein